VSDLIEITLEADVPHPDDPSSVHGVLVCPLAGADPKVQNIPRSGIAVEYRETDFEILPGHQPMTAILPPGARIFLGRSVVSPAALSDELQTATQRACILDVASNEPGKTVVTLIPLGECSCLQPGS
jgi:hypothetical protein